MQENNNEIFCGSECLWHSAPAESEKIKIGKKDNNFTACGDGEFFYFPVQTVSPPGDRLLGSYENRHQEALKLLQENPVAHVVKVEELCGCAYKIRQLNGKLFFDANTIPDALRASQHEFLVRRETCLAWKDWRKWMVELTDGLLELHRLGLSHGDVTAFNAIIDADGNAVWIDLENLNFDAGQRDNDTVSFLFYVLLFSYELLLEAPKDFIPNLEKVITAAVSGDGILEGLLATLEQAGQADEVSIQENHMAIFGLVNCLAELVTGKDNSFYTDFTKQLFRGNVYFQKDFLWLVNYNMKVMHYEKRSIFDIYDQMERLNDRTAMANKTVNNLTSNLEQKNRELNQLAAEVSEKSSIQAHQEQLLAASLRENVELKERFEAEKASILAQQEQLLTVSSRENVELRERLAQAEQGFEAEKASILAQKEQLLAASSRENVELRERLAQAEQGFEAEKASILAQQEQLLTVSSRENAELRERLEQADRRFEVEKTSIQAQHDQLQAALSRENVELRERLEQAEQRFEAEKASIQVRHEQMMTAGLKQAEQRFEAEKASIQAQCDQLQDISFRENADLKERLNQAGKLLEEEKADSDRRFMEIVGEFQKKYDELTGKLQEQSECNAGLRENISRQRVEIDKLSQLEPEAVRLRESNELLRKLHDKLREEQETELEIREQVEIENAALLSESQSLREKCDLLHSEKEHHAGERRRVTEALDLSNIELAKTQAANKDLMMLNHAGEHKIDRIGRLADRLQRYDLELPELQMRSAQLARKEQNLRELLNEVRLLLRSSSENSSFRVAKALQIIREPALCGMSGKFEVAKKMIASKLSGKPFYPEYLALSNAINMIDDGLCRIAWEDNGETTERLVPPDESVLISIILPVYNQADLLAESIDSVIAQTYRNWELIIINDGSKDNVAEVVGPYLHDKRIRYLEQANQKLPKALSNGFSFVNGELLTWTSADNNMRPEMLTRLSAFLRLHPDVEMVYADYMAIDDLGAPLTADWFRPQNKFRADSPELHLPRNTELLNIVRDNFIGASFMYRRSTLGIVGEYDPQLGVEDYDYWMRINSLLKIAHLGSDELLYEYRVHGNSLNGKAAEFRILEKALQLMEYEKQRYAFYLQSFEVYGSYRPGDLYFADFKTEFYNEMPSEKALIGKKILLVKGSDLKKYSADELKRFNFVAAFFDLNEENETGKNAYFIRSGLVKCFARPDSAAARRAGVFTSNLVECYPYDFGRLALAMANNRIFFDATHNAEQTARVLPEIPGNIPGKIVILLEQMGTGGMEQVAFDMAETFVKSGKEVVFCCVHESASNMNKPENVRFRFLDKDNPDEDFRRLLSEEGYEAVIAHYTTWGAKAASESRVPYYQVVHNTYVWFDDDARKQYLDADAYTAGYIAVSGNVAWYAMERMNLPPEKIMIIENGVSFDKFTYSETAREKQRRELGLQADEFAMLNPASCYAVKGQLNLIHAFAAAYEKNPKLRLILAGKILEEFYADAIRAVIAEQHLEEAVILDFFNDMASLYSAADAVVLPSWWEGCSLAVAEAVQMRRPILASKVGDIERQTGGVNCILYDLPLSYLTDLTEKNCGNWLYKPDPETVERLIVGIVALAEGNYPKSNEWGISERSAEDTYRRYLKAMNYLAGGFTIGAIRHNV